jgi:AbrB family looped-hinge helix DNA binding protein
MGVHHKLSTTVSTKGQVILPKAIRDVLNWKPGTRLAVERTRGGVLLKAEPIFPPTTVDQVYGCLRYDGPPISIEEMDAAIVREGKRRARD